LRKNLRPQTRRFGGAGKHFLVDEPACTGSPTLVMTSRIYFFPMGSTQSKPSLRVCQGGGFEEFWKQKNFPVHFSSFLKITLKTGQEVFLVLYFNSN
jgi:hypothetical protein